MAFIIMIMITMLTIVQSGWVPHSQTCHRRAHQRASCTRSVMSFFYFYLGLGGREDDIVERWSDDRIVFYRWLCWQRWPHGSNKLRREPLKGAGLAWLADPSTAVPRLHLQVGVPWKTSQFRFQDNYTFVASQEFQFSSVFLNIQRDKLDFGILAGPRAVAESLIQMNMIWTKKRKTRRIFCCEVTTETDGTFTQRGPRGT